MTGRRWLGWQCARARRWKLIGAWLLCRARHKSHARRYYHKAEPHYPQTITVLDLIDDLFAIEAEATALSDTLPQLYRNRAELRRERSRPVIDSIHQWMLAQRVLPGSSLSNAIPYSDKLWKGLTRFLDDPMVAIHNSATEGAIRGIALGRRNHF